LNHKKTTAAAAASKQAIEAVALEKNSSSDATK
jgi:hypothetical protein